MRTGADEVEVVVAHRARTTRRTTSGVLTMGRREHGFDPFAPGCEVDVLRSQA